MWKRSHSSASPAAVGESSTGRPTSPQRVSWTSLFSRRSERQRLVSLLIASSSALLRGGLRLRRRRHARHGSEHVLRQPRPAGEPVVRAPGLDRLEEVLGEALDLVLGEELLDLLADRVPRALRAEVLPGDLVELRELLGAERLEAFGVEVRTGEPAVLLDALLEAQVARAHLVEGRPVEVHAHLAPC